MHAHIAELHIELADEQHYMQCTEDELVDELHMKCLQAFYAKNYPVNLPRVRELYGKLGKGIWNALEKKYPGNTASYTKASAVLLQPESCCNAC